MSPSYPGGYIGNRPGWSSGRQPGVWTLYDRIAGQRTVTQEVQVAAGATVTGAVELTSPCVIKAVRLGKAAWIRFYSSVVARDLDESRLVTADPASGSGVNLEIRTPADSTINTAPVVYMVGLDPQSETTFPFRVTNESLTNDVLLEVTYLPLAAYA